MGTAIGSLSLSHRAPTLSKSTTMIYLDYNSTTPLSDSVLAAMTPWFQDSFSNPSSAHGGGREAAAVVERSESELLELVGCRSARAVFTSGATESINLALRGGSAPSAASVDSLVTFAAEHKAVLDTAEALAASGLKVDVLPVGRDAAPDLDALRERLDQSGRALVSVMAVNNEVGTISDLSVIGEMCRSAGALLHVDGSQALGKLQLSMDDCGIDLLSISAHKAYGPKGSGALIVRRGVELEPMVLGGGHQGGIRSGTINVPGVVGLAAAAAESDALMEAEGKRQLSLITQLVAGFRGALDEVEVLGKLDNGRIFNTVNLRFDGADAEAVMANAPAVAISSGSACSSRIPAPSHVLLAMGLSVDDAEQCLRFSIGRPTVASDVDEAVERISAAVRRVREMMS